MTNLKDVARYTGLSVSTVSRTLSNKSYVKDGTREKVLEAVRLLNYSPNIMAQSLKKGRSNTIALMIPSIQNMIFPDLTRGVEDTARKNGYTVILCNTDENIEIEKSYINTLRPRLIDGFVIASMMPHSTHIQQLRKDNFPMVLALRAYDNSIDAVVVDNRRAAHNAVKYLIERGHRRIAITLGNTELTLYSERYKGYRQALEENNIPLDEKLVIRERFNIGSFYNLTKALLESGVIPDSVFATTDAQAITVMRAIYDCGYRIPGDISVIGFDNVEMASMVEPPLSTVSQPLYEIGVLAAQKLIFQIEYKEKHGVLDEPMIDVVETHLLVRKSTK
ncbi:LacI family transcriptional regulator [Spirochaetia bacterium]|nr:LacI family transcriptional regulator [Spirochaetia bacterium]